MPPPPGAGSVGRSAQGRSGVLASPFVGERTAGGRAFGRKNNREAALSNRLAASVSAKCLTPDGESGFRGYGLRVAVGALVAGVAGPSPRAWRPTGRSAR